VAAAVLSVASVIFVYRSFYGIRIPAVGAD
jgi:hypothetical protein